MDGSMNRKVTCRTKKKDFNVTNGSKGKTQELIQKKNPTGGMDVSVVFVVRTLAWNVK
jgi:hypothetical protein